MSTEAPDSSSELGFLNLPRPLGIFLCVALLLLVLALVAEAFCRFILHLDFPYRSPLLFEHFPDLVNLRPRFRFFHTIEFFTDNTDALCMYPAPVAVCYRLIFTFIPHDVTALLLFILLVSIVAAYLFGRSLCRTGLTRRSSFVFATTCLLTSYPLWFELKQANMEIFPWVALAIGVWCLARRKGYSAAMCFGIAGAMKITPFLYLGLFLSRRQFKHIAIALMSAVAVTLPSLWLVYPNIPVSWRMSNAMISRFRDDVTLRTYAQVSFDHSVFGVIKQLTVQALSPTHFSQLLTVYTVVAVGTLLLLYFLRIQRLPVINQVICLCVASLIVPPTSFDYTLMNLYFPWALLALFIVLQSNKGRDMSVTIPAMICFAVLFVPETEIIFHQYSFGGQVKAVTLLALFVYSFKKPFTADGDYLSRSIEEELAHAMS